MHISIFLYLAFDCAKQILRKAQYRVLKQEETEMYHMKCLSIYDVQMLIIQLLFKSVRMLSAWKDSVLHDISKHFREANPYNNVLHWAQWGGPSKVSIMEHQWPGRLSV